MRLGLVSDLHGNLEGFQRVLSELDGRVDETLVAGDAMDSYRFSSDILDLIRDRRLPYILGNHEIALLQAAATCPPSSGSAEQWRYLADLPRRLLLEYDGKRLLMVHASPWEPEDAYLYPGSPELSRAPELGVDFLVLGHTHVPMVTQVGSTLVINPGSAGDARGRNGGALSYAILDTKTAEVEFCEFPDPMLAGSSS